MQQLQSKVLHLPAEGGRTLVVRVRPKPGCTKVVSMAAAGSLFSGMPVFVCPQLVH
jgi:hypothetical protein